MFIYNRDELNDTIDYLESIGFYKSIPQNLKIKRRNNKLNKKEKIILVRYFFTRFKGENCPIDNLNDCEFLRCRKKCFFKDVVKPEEFGYSISCGYNTVPNYS
jgi:hypothetical protein